MFKIRFFFFIFILVNLSLRTPHNTIVLIIRIFIFSCPLRFVNTFGPAKLFIIFFVKLIISLIFRRNISLFFLFILNLITDSECNFLIRFSSCIPTFFVFIIKLLNGHTSYPRNSVLLRTLIVLGFFEPGLLHFQIINNFIFFW